MIHMDSSNKFMYDRYGGYYELHNVIIMILYKHST
jgi:hypothetical protein